MDEQTYEKIVDRLAQRDEDTILATAISVIENLGDDSYVDDAVDAAKEAVEADLFADPRWTKVEAVDISDIAYDAAQRAWSQIRTWNEA